MSEKHPTDDIVRLTSTENYQEAHLLKNALEDAGIRCQVAGADLTAGFGELGPTAPEVWVFQHDLERARQVLQSLRAERSANAAAAEEEE